MINNNMDYGKLIELLNEYEKSSYEKDTNWVYEGEEWEYYEPNNRIIKGNWENENILTRFELCSKQFGFIQRLVEQDKIDIKKLIIKGEMRSGWDFENKKGNEEVGEEIWNKYFSELTLMLLSIQDEPIRFLCEIIK